MQLFIDETKQSRGYSLFFLKRKRKEFNPIPPAEVYQTRKYKTNYFRSKESFTRSLRFKSQRKDEIGEYKIEVALGRLPCSFQRLSNLLLKTEKGFIHIDHLLVSPYGLFVLEVNNLAGIILGQEDAFHWHQSIRWRVKTFPNPLFENQNRIQFLMKHLRLEESLPFFSYVTFNRRCNLKVISGAVFYDIDILTAILKRIQSQPEVLRDAEVLAIVKRIEQLNITDSSIRNEYSARLHKQKFLARANFGDIRCAVCQKPVTERTARYCIAHPDKYNWQIYCAKHQKQARVPQRTVYNSYPWGETK